MSLREEVKNEIDDIIQLAEVNQDNSIETTNNIISLIEKKIDEMIKEHTITSQDNETTLFYSGYRYGLQDFKGMLK